MQAFEINLLSDIRSIKKAENFDDLLNIIERAAPKGIGELMVYDTAVRVGAFLNLSPDKIYLHAGTKTGLKKLNGKFKGKTITKNQLPEPFKSSSLDCYELEDVLCIYKNEF